MDQKPLTAKQQAFVDEYLVDLNASAAAIRAGYSAKASRNIGYELLTKYPRVAAAVQAAMDARSKQTGITAESILRRLDQVADRCMEAVPVMEFDHVEKEMRQKTAYVKEGDGEAKEVGVYEFDSAGACRALELLGKHLKLFTDKVQIDAGDGLAELMAKARARRRGDA